MKLFLDDERYPPEEEGWLVARGIGDFAVLARANCNSIELISFDHDLGSGPNGALKDGFDCAKVLIELMDSGCEFNKLEEIRVHSMNPIGAEQISSFLESAQRHGVFPNDIVIKGFGR